MEGCVFCGIGGGAIPANKLYEDDQMVAFYDLEPVAPTHFLVIPKKHIATLNDLLPDDANTVGAIFLKISQLALQCGLTGGYRVVTNCGEDGGQTVPHLHFHVLGGRSMEWPPG